MKRIIMDAFLLTVVGLILTTASYAQHFDTQVPFEFSVGHKTLPAGEYRITKVGEHTLALYNQGNQSGIFFLTDPMSSLTRSNPALRFEFQDGRAVLSEVWASEGKIGRAHV